MNTPIQEPEKEKKPRKKTKQELFETDSSKTKKTKTKKPKASLTYKNKVNRRFGQPLNKGNDLKNLSKISKIPISILKKVFERGEGAYETNPRSVRLTNYKKSADLRRGPRLSKTQWAYARTYAFVEKVYNKNEPQNQDTDLIKEARKFI